MYTYKILSDTSCDIPAAVLEQLDVTYVPFHVSFDTVNYLKELQDITPDEFYDKINADKLYPKTSLPSVQDYMDAMEPVLKEGKDVFCICLTANFSGSYQSGVNAANILGEAYPERKIIVLDSACVTGSQGLLVYEACRMRDAGYSMEPIIVMRDGELYPESKVRGHKKALKTIMDMTRNEIDSEKEHYRVLLVRGEKERHATVEEMRQTLLAEGFDVMDEIWPVGITIGTHTGPTPIGICYIKKYEYVK